jgi:hypothetical protein
MGLIKYENKMPEGQKGNVLILAILMLALGAIIIAPLLAFAASGLKQGTIIEERTIQLYVADGGMEQAVFWINNPDSITVAELPTDVGDSGSLPLATANDIYYKTYVTLFSTDSGTNTYLVTTYAGPDISDNSNPEDVQIGQYTRIDAQVTSGSSYGSPFTNAIVAVNGFTSTTNGGELVKGDVFIINGGMTLPKKEGFSISGDVYCNGDITGKGNITGTDIMVTPGSTVSSGVKHPNADITYGTQTFSLPDEAMMDLRTDMIERTSDVDEVTVGTEWSYSGDLAASGFYSETPSYSVNGNVTFGWQSVIFNCPVYISGNLTFGSGNATFYGPVTVEGTIYMTGSGNITFHDTVTAGNIEKAGSSSPVFYDAVKVENDFTFPTGSGDPVFYSTLYIGGNLSSAAGYVITLSDALYVGEDLILEAGAYIKTAPNSENKYIIVDGDIKMTGGTALGDNEIPLIINLPQPLGTSTTITLDNGANAYAAIYAPYANATLLGNGQLHGAIIANTVTLGDGKGSPGITYNSSLINRDDIPNGGISSGSGPASVETWDISLS